MNAERAGTKAARAAGHTVTPRLGSQNNAGEG